MQIHKVSSLLLVLHVILGSYASANTVISNSQLQACVQDGTVRCLYALPSRCVKHPQKGPM